MALNSKRTRRLRRPSLGPESHETLFHTKDLENQIANTIFQKRKTPNSSIFFSFVILCVVPPGARGRHVAFTAGKCPPGTENRHTALRKDPRGECDVFNDADLLLPVSPSLSAAAAAAVTGAATLLRSVPSDVDEGTLGEALHY